MDSLRTVASYQSLSTSRKTGLRRAADWHDVVVCAVHAVIGPVQPLFGESRLMGNDRSPTVPARTMERTAYRQQGDHHGKHGGRLHPPCQVGCREGSRGPRSRSGETCHSARTQSCRGCAPPSPRDTSATPTPVIEGARPEALLRPGSRPDSRRESSHEPRVATPAARTSPSATAPTCAPAGTPGRN